MSDRIAPPVAAPRPHRWQFGEHAWDDPYAWLERADDPDVLAYLTAENAYREAALADTDALQAALYQEMVGRIQETDSSVPVRHGDWLYYTRTEAGRQYPMLARRRGANGAEEMLLDLNEMVGPSGFIQLRRWLVSPDQRYLAYRLNESGGLEGSVRLKDLTTGEELPDRLEPAGPGLAWTNDGGALYWERQQADSLRSSEVRRHRPGTDAADDVVVYQEPDIAFDLNVRKARDGSFVFITASAGETTEVRWLPAGSPEVGEPTVFAPRRTGIEYAIDHHAGHFLIVTNEDAENFRLLTAPVATPAEQRDLITHDPDFLLDTVHPFASRLVITGRQGGFGQVLLVEPRTGARMLVELPEASHAVRVIDDENPDFAAPEVRIRYSSLTTPASVYDVDLVTGALRLRKQAAIPSGYDKDAYAAERLTATAEDGATVPISLLRRRDQAPGPRPLLLTGYGSYGFSYDPSFHADVLSLIDRGATFAIAHIRGGEELGRAWYKAGKLLHKRNTFTDFIAVADALVADGRTTPGQLIISGGSAGGLLMGAVTNLRPDLARAVVAAVPFVDVMRVMFDPTLPLTTGEYTEWGNPADPEYYAYMRSYSPYDNVVPADYPEMLLTAGLNDDQVPYWQPAKWLASIRTRNTGDRPQYLRINMGAGHGGASGRYDNLREEAHDFAFMLRAWGLADAAS